MHLPRTSRVRAVHLPGALLLIASESKETSEVRYVQRKAAAATPRLVRQRAFGVRYEVDSHSPSRSLLLLTNAAGAVNSELRFASLDAPSVWRPLSVASAAGAPPVLAHDADRSLDAVFVFDTHLAVTGREGGAPQIWVAPLQLAGGDAARVAGDSRQAAAEEEAEAEEVAVAVAVPRAPLLMREASVSRCDASSCQRPTGSGAKAARRRTEADRGPGSAAGECPAEEGGAPEASWGR